MATHWDGLVLGDYEWVMPLPWKEKLGLRYACQPAFTPQLGVFGPDAPSKAILHEFLKTSRSHFRFGEIYLNSSNVIYSAPACDNFLLDIARGHDSISAGYSENHKRNLKKAFAAGLVYEKTERDPDSMEPAIAFLRQQVPHLSREDFQRLRKSCLALWQRGQCLQRIVRSQEGKMLSRTLFLHDGRRIINLLPFTYEAGRPLGAGHFLLDRLIAEFSGQPLLLDFEGSIIPSIARFYSGFGAQAEQYPFIRWNDLPLPIRWLKPAGDPVSFLP
jgi:hypothetical protein